MNKKVILSALGGAVAFTLLGGLVFEVLLKDLMTEMMAAMGSAANPNPDFILIILANLTLSVLLALLLNRSNVSTFSGGAMGSVWIVFLLILWFDIWMFATFTFMTPKMMAIDIVSNTIMGTLGGGVIGQIQGKLN
ncbi:MAG: hypothetical protein U0X91_27235 [Spirosomataceae bacterium]